MLDVASVSVDVLVIGAGGCGLTAALAAHADGLDVAILEKASAPGGNTTLSSGSIPAAGSALQAAAGITDSAADFAADLRAAAKSHDADELVDALTGVSADLIDFLSHEGVRLDVITGYRHVGHRTYRLHAPPNRRGSELIADLSRAVARRDIPLALGTGANRLITSNGRVIGAMSGTDRIEARAVILACNGFGAAPDLLAQHCPPAARAIYAGSPHSTGEALIWGSEIGAATGNMAAYQGHAGLSTKTGALMTWTLIERGAVIVDGYGRRFGDETVGYSGFADLALAATGPFNVIYDTRIRDDVAAGQPDFAEACRMGVAVMAQTSRALADMLSLPPDELAATLTAVKAMASCAGVGDADADPFGRRDWGFGLSHDSLCATEIQPALFHTQGGLRVDASARVLDKAGHAIGGLYAGGGAAMGISGRAGGGGYMSGNGLLAALGLGLIAGRAAAADLGDRHESSVPLQPQDGHRPLQKSQPGG